MIYDDSKFQTLSSFCQNGSLLKTKVALLTFYKIQYSSWIEKLILIFGYLQLISQALFASSLLFEGSNHQQYLYKMVIYAFKLVNPSELLSYEGSDSLTLTVLVMLFCCTFLKIGLFVKAIDVSIRNKTMNSWLLLLWRWIYKLQTRVLYFLFTSFWVKTMLETPERGFSPFGMKKSEVLFVSSFMLMIEALLSLTLETQLCCFLSTKSFLSSKNNQLEILTFLQKLAIQVFMLSIRSDSEGLAWITSLIGIIMGIIRYYQFFAVLPLYHLDALLLQGSLLATVISLNLAYFVDNILKASDYGVLGINFVIITWGLLALLTNKISYQVIKIQILLLISQKNHRQAPEILLHRVIATKELKRNERIPITRRSGYAFSHLISTHQNLNLQEIFGLGSCDCFCEGESPSKEKMNKVYLLYLKELLKNHPRSFLVKLHTAHKSSRNSEPYTQTIKIVSEMKEKKWSMNYLSYSLLLYEIEKSMLASCEKNKRNLDLLSYIKSKILMDDLRNDMLKQTDFHLQVCRNILSDLSNFAEIQASAKNISKLKSIIKRKFTRLSEILPEHHISPLLWYAEYHLVANNSITKSEKFYEVYMQRYTRTQKLLKEPSLSQENLYQDSNAFLLVSARKTEFGKILYCNKSLTDLCGGQNLKSYQGSEILALFPKYLRAYYDELFKENELSEILNRVHRGYVYNNKDKHLIEVDFYVKYHPYLSQGLCLNMIIRPVPMMENSDFLLLSQNGDIIGSSKAMLELLNLKKKPMVPIKMISEQLETVNSVFNFILGSKEGIRKESNSSPSWRQHSPRRMSKFSQMTEVSESNEIYRAFTSGEQQIQLSPYHEENFEGSKEHFAFSCCVQILNLGELQIKKISLKLIRSNERQDSKPTLKRVIESPQTLVTKEEDIEEDYFPPTSLDHIQTTTRYYFDTASHIPTSPNAETQGDLPLLSSERQRFKERRTTRTRDPPTNFMTKNSSLNNMEAAPSATGRDIPPDNSNQIENYRPLKRLKTRKLSKDPSSSHNHPLKSTENAENRAYRNAILTKSSPKSLRGLCFIFYLVLVLTFAGQLLMESISNHTMKDLQVRKDLLKESEERLYKGALIQVNGRGIVQQFAGILKAGGVYHNMATVIQNLQIRLNDMMEANDRMLDLVYSLDKETQEQLFVQDIKIKGTYLDSEDETYQLMNTFQITGETVNAIKTLVNMNTTKTPKAALSIFNYLAINLVDDFLSKSKEITDILTSSVEEQKESFQYTTNLFLTLNPFLFVSIGILLVSIIWNQYRIEDKSMKALIKVPGREVRRIADRLLLFKKDLLNEENFEKRWTPRTRKTEKSTLQSEEQRISVYSKSSATHKTQYKEFRRRYYHYVLRVVLCISALVAITIWDLVMTQDAIKVIYNRQNQLQFANYISNRVTVGAMTYAQLFFMNNTIKVENQYPLDSLPRISEMMKDIQRKVPKRFLEANGNYNPEVQKIIFENNPECQGFTPDFMLYCTTLLNQGQPVNMIVVISAYQGILARKFQDYVNSNKSTSEDLVKADALTETPLPYFVVIAEEAHRIARIMDDSMTQKINEMHREKKVILVVFTIGLLVVGVLIWFFLLKMIREAENDFKKVLQIFPVNLVLSSFLLKRFLQQSSRNPLLK